MVSLDQVKLLENKVAKTIEFVGQVIGENAGLRQKEAELQAKLEAHQKRIDELEALIARFKEDQSRIEGGILSALERLNRFEDAIEKNLNEKTAARAGNAGSSSAQHPAAVSQPAPAPQPEAALPTPAAEPVKAPVKKAPKAQQTPVSQQASAPHPAASGGPKKGDTGGEGVFFEIAETETPEELLDGEEAAPPANKELDIF